LKTENFPKTKTYLDPDLVNFVLKRVRLPLTSCCCERDALLRALLLKWPKGIICRLSRVSLHSQMQGGRVFWC
jgi:hypothetical protein